MENIIQLDRNLTLWLNTHSCPSLDGFWIFMSDKFVWIPLYVLVAALMIWRLGFKRGLVAIACIALAFFFDERFNNLIKETVQRIRPCNDSGMAALGIRVLQTAGGWSFPSGHSCNVFGFAMSSSLCLIPDSKPLWGSQNLCRKLYTVFIFIWAGLIAWSRVVLSCHFFGDILVGALLGCTVGLAIGCAFLKIDNKFPSLRN